MHTVQFIKAHDNAKLPVKAKKGDACSDVFSVEDVVLKPMIVTQVRSGLEVASIPSGYKIALYDRSGFGNKGILVANGVGVIDEGFRGEIKALLLNTTAEDIVLSAGTRMCQFALEAVIPVEYEFATAKTESDRGEGGFGSTGVQ